MAREKLRTLTEQMFYTLLCFYNECCGMDIMKKTREITKGRVCIGSGTLYNLIEQFLDAELICETKVEGRRKSYLLTEKGKQNLENEYQRLKVQMDDYDRLVNDAACPSTEEGRSLR